MSDFFNKGDTIACCHGVGKHPAVIYELMICVMDSANHAMQSFSSHVGRESN